MAEVHFIGDISCGLGFGGARLFCVFEIVYGTQWTLVEGRTSGCTHIMSQLDAEVPWNFPVDVHFSCTSVQGWPKLSVQVWQVDDYGRKDIAGYGMTYLPMPRKGEQEVEILTWRPTYWHPSFFMRLYETMRLFFMGGSPVLRDNALIHGNDERFKLHTIGSGTVKVQLNVISRGMKQSGMIF